MYITCLRNCGENIKYYKGEEYECNRINLDFYEIKGKTFCSFVSLKFIRNNFNIEEMKINSELENLFNTLMDI